MLDLKPSWLVLRPGWLVLRHLFFANDMIVPDSFRVSGLDSRHSVVHGVTVAIFMKMQNLQFCFLLWLSNDDPRLKKVIEPNRTTGRCAGVACQLLPKCA